MWEWDYKENWALKNWCFWIVVLEKTLESPLDSKEIHPVNHKGNQSWIFIGRTDAETPILWPPDGKSWLIWEDPDPGKGWRWEGKGTTEDEMVGWHHWLDGHELEQAPGVCNGQGSQLCCSPWCHKVWDMFEWLSWVELKELEKFFEEVSCKVKYEGWGRDIQMKRWRLFQSKNKFVEKPWGKAKRWNFHFTSILKIDYWYPQSDSCKLIFSDFFDKWLLAIMSYIVQE